MTARIHRWTCGPLGDDVERSLQHLATLDGAAHVAVMPDAHLAHDVCVGTVLATRGRIVPAAVGGDIGCGMAAVAFDAPAAALEDAHLAARVLHALDRGVPVLRHHERLGLPEPLAALPLSDGLLHRRALRDGAVQLGTLGRGNHFVELQSDEEGRLWAMVHSGSRSMGVAIRDHHVRSAVPDRGSGLAVLEAESDAGRAYLRDQRWALAYAEANRHLLVERVADAVRHALAAERIPDTYVSCHHNHVREETHFDETWLVHRKGAISAADGEPGIVPGSMGTASFLTRGRGLPDALRSSSHGAGRAMSRTEARRSISLRSFRRSVEHVWYDHRKERRLLDEAPGAYRDVDAVMRAQRELTRIERRLRPLLSFKGT